MSEEELIEYVIIRNNIVKEEAKEEMLKYYYQLNEKIRKAKDKLICWGDLLDADFQKEMLEILGYDEDKYIDWLKRD